MIKRIIAHLFGFTLVGLGVSLIIFSNQGAFPLDALNWFLAELTPSKFIDNGVWNYIMSTLIAIVTYLIIRKPKVFISIVMVLFVSLSISLFGSLILNTLPQHIALKIILAPVGLLIIAFGANFTIVSGLPAAPVEQLMVVLTIHTNSLKRSRYYMEAVFAALAIVVGLIYGDLFKQIGWFSVVAILFIGPLMELLMPLNKKIIGLKENENEVK